MKTYEEMKAEIDQMTHEEMCRLWRYAAPGHPYFDSTNPISQYYKDRLFNYFGGFTPRISKSL